MSVDRPPYLTPDNGRVNSTRVPSFSDIDQEIEQPELNNYQSFERAALQPISPSPPRYNADIKTVETEPVYTERYSPPQNNEVKMKQKRNNFKYKVANYWRRYKWWIIIIISIVLIGILMFAFILAMSTRKRKTGCVQPQPPVTVNTNVTSPTSCNVSWPADPNIFYYIILRKENGVVSDTLFDSKDKTYVNNFNYENLTIGSTQTFLVIGVNSCGVVSSPSAVTTLNLCSGYPQQPNVVEIIKPSNPSVNPYIVYFIRSPDATGYVTKLYALDKLNVNPPAQSSLQTSFSCTGDLCSANVLFNANTLLYSDIYASVDAINSCGNSANGVINLPI